MLKRIAKYVQKILLVINIIKKLLAQRNVQQLKAISQKEIGNHNVYCLVAEKHHAFSIESGIIVHNCYDVVRYRLTSEENRISTKSINLFG